MMRFILLFMLMGITMLHAQNRFYVQVNDPNNATLLATVNGAGINVILNRNLNFPNQGLNAVAITLNPGNIDQLRQALGAQYGQGNFLFAVDPLSLPDEGSGDSPAAPILATLPGTNAALDNLVPSRPITSPPTGLISGVILVDIVGTGIDYDHPDLVGVNFVPPLSVMPDGSGGLLPGDVDYHNHETRLAGCIAGTGTGLLSALGTTPLATYRSVLCYDKPIGGPAVATTYTSDCLAALAELTFEHELRLSGPYLKNHAAVLCYAHSVAPTAPGTEVRVGHLEAKLDYAWERGIFTSISAGNRPVAAASTSPAGAGEWITFPLGPDVFHERYWPMFGSPTYDLPPMVGFETSMPGSDFHLKSGAHDIGVTPAPWFVDSTLGSALNTTNPLGLGPAMNHGVDLFAPGEDIPVPATRIVTPPEVGLPTETIDGVTYSIERGYQMGNGTSYSAAYTAGLATRILQLRPWASPPQVRAAILDVLPAPPELATLTVPDLSTLDPMSLTYDDWIVRYNNIAPFGYFASGMDDELADPDLDGVVNLVEYHCGMDPRHQDAQHGPVMMVDFDALTITVKMQLASYLPAPAVVDWKIESSINLDDWSDEGKGTVTSFSETAENGDGINIEGLHSFTTTAPKKFYRVSIYTVPE